jgi:hypothetical protein
VTARTGAGNPVVECLTHGPMIYRMGCDWWECVGFDGEGCSVPLVSSEDAAREDHGIPGIRVTRAA